MGARWGNRIGAALLGAWAVWVLVSCAMNGQPIWEAWPYFTAPAFTVLGVAAGRLLLPRAAPERLAAALLLVTGYVLLSVAFRGGAGGGPLGYANSNAALANLLAALAAVAALRATGRARRWAWISAGMAAAAVPFTLSVAAIALLAPLAAAILLAAVAPRRRRRWPAPAAGVTIVAAASTITYFTTLPTWPKAMTAAFSGARHELWSDALTLWAKAPVTGSGPGSFRAFSLLAKDPDTARAHMSLLQVGSELGWVGVVLLAGLVALVLVRLARVQPGEGLVATAAVTVLLVHSFVDHLLEFPPVMLILGAVLGLATADNQPAGSSRASSPSTTRSSR